MRGTRVLFPNLIMTLPRGIRSRFRRSKRRLMTLHPPLHSPPARIPPRPMTERGCCLPLQARQIAIMPLKHRLSVFRMQPSFNLCGSRDATGNDLAAVLNFSLKTSLTLTRVVFYSYLLGGAKDPLYRAVYLVVIGIH